MAGVLSWWNNHYFIRMWDCFSWFIYLNASISLINTRYWFCFFLRLINVMPRISLLIWRHGLPSGQDCHASYPSPNLIHGYKSTQKLGFTYGIALQYRQTHWRWFYSIAYILWTAFSYPNFRLISDFFAHFEPAVINKGWFGFFCFSTFLAC